MPSDPVAEVSDYLNRPVKDLVTRFGMPSYTPDQGLSGREWLQKHPEYRSRVVTGLGDYGYTEDHLNAALGSSNMRPPTDDSGTDTETPRPPKDIPDAATPPPLGKTLRPSDRPATDPGKSMGDLASGWNSWLDKPNNRAALMQFGIAMLQPIGFGENFGSHFGNAVGAAGAAARNITTQEQQDEKARTEAELRESRASAAEKSASAAETRAYYAGENTRLRGERDTTSNLNKTLTAQAGARAKYDIYVNQVGKRNTDPLRDPKAPLETPMPFNQWLKSAEGSEALTEAGGGGGTPAPTAPPPGASPGPARSSWNALKADPSIISASTEIRRAISGHDPAMVEKAKQYINTVIAPHVDPSELPQVYRDFGL